MRQYILDEILKDDDLYKIFSNEARKEGYICPITHETFNDPVIAGDGYTYERRAIENWLVRSNSSPMTRETISHTHLIKNIDMKNRVLSFLEEFHKKHIATICTPAEVSSAAAFTSRNFGLFSSNGMQADGRRETETSSTAVNSTAESVTGVTASASAGSENMRQRYVAWLSKNGCPIEDIPLSDRRRQYLKLLERFYVGSNITITYERNAGLMPDKIDTVTIGRIEEHKRNEGWWSHIYSNANRLCFTATYYEANTCYRLQCTGDECGPAGWEITDSDSHVKQIKSVNDGVEIVLYNKGETLLHDEYTGPVSDSFAEGFVPV